jgi:hypothetical protein
LPKSAVFLAISVARSAHKFLPFESAIVRGLIRDAARDNSLAAPPFERAARLAKAARTASRVSQLTYFPRSVKRCRLQNSFSPAKLFAKHRSRGALFVSCEKKSWICWTLLAVLAIFELPLVFNVELTSASLSRKNPASTSPKLAGGVGVKAESVCTPRRLKAALVCQSRQFEGEAE